MSLKNSEATMQLNTGAKIPVVGLGTWKSLENDAYKAVVAGLKAGYRHIDGAAIYLNEGQVGQAIKDSGVPRDQIFVTTKLWGTQQRDPAKALDESLKRLGLDYVDLYLIHWPVALKTDSIKDNNFLCIPELPSGKRAVDTEWNFVKTWELMQELPKSGKTKSVGVSNFSINNLKELFAAPTTKVTPVVNQIELHPLLPQFELQEFCKQHDMAIEAYSPLGGTDAPILSEPVIKEIAEKYKITPANVCISWAVQRGVIVLPKSVTESRIISNLQVLTLAKEDMEKIGNLSKVKGEKRVVTIDWSPFPTFE